MNLATNKFLAVLGVLFAWYMLTLTAPVSKPGHSYIEVRGLFRDLVQAKLITVQEGAHLALPEPDLAELRAWYQLQMSKQDQELLSNLYHSAAGRDLRKRIVAWNHSRRIAAVRDNSASNLGITHKAWQAYRCGSPVPLEAETQVSETFGYVHQGRLHTGFGDWSAVAADASCVEWRGRFWATKAAPIEVWYVGQQQKLANWEPKIRPRPYSPPRKPRNLPDCVVGNGMRLQQAGAWRIPKSAWRHRANGAWQLKLRLLVRPANNPSLATSQGPGVCVAEHLCKPQWQSSMSAECGTAPASISRKDLAQLAPSNDTLSMLKDNSCVSMPQQLPPHPQAWRLKTSDGISLLTNEFTPTHAAKDLDLVQLVGIGPNDTHGLGGQLRSVQPAGSLTLTLHSGMQKKAKVALRYGLRRLPAFFGTAHEERHAALVLVRTDGAILAAAGYPNPPERGQITVWDRAAFSQVYPENDPFLVRAWEGVDRHQAAGSTFKPVIALTALTATAQRPEILGMLQGLAPAAFQRLTGLRLTATEIDPYQMFAGRHSTRKRHPIRNFRIHGRFEALGNLCRKQGKNFNCSSPYNLGLVSAVRESLNVWFVALAMLVDGKAADNYQQAMQHHRRKHLSAERRPVLDLHLTKLLTTLGFGAATPLLRNPPAGVTLCAKPDQLDIQGSSPIPTRWILAQTSIGQGTAVTPLRMATVATTIAGNAQNVVQPYLDAAWNGQAVPQVKSQPLGLDVTLLKTGMQAVVKAGTAHLAFKRAPAVIRDHTYAKTGTAQVGRRDGSGKQEPYVSTWMIGWHEPQSKPAFAFACLVTHVDKRGKNRNTGGHVCGPIVAEFLRTLYADASTGT